MPTPLPRLKRLLLGSPLLTADLHEQRLPKKAALDVVLDSTREQLASVMQKGDNPIVLGMNWRDYASHRDEELRNMLEAGLQKRLEAVRHREAAAKD